MSRRCFDRRAPRAVLVLLLVIAVAAATVPAAVRGQELPSELDAVAASGADVAVLAAESVTPSPDAPALTLTRVIPDGDVESYSLGAELWYVEAGTLTLTLEGQEPRTYQTGEHAVVPTAADYVFRVEGDESACPSVLRLAVTTVIGMEVGSTIAGPALGGEDDRCPGAGTLMDGGVGLTTPAPGALAFIARVSWPGGTFPTEFSFSGPVGYAPETGALRIEPIYAANALLAPGSWAVVNGGQIHAVEPAGGEPATALVAGLIAGGDGGPPTPTPAATTTSGVQGNTYTSPTYGYSLTWDASWAVISETSTGVDDRLQLNNGVSDLYVEGFGNYPSDPQACVDSIVAQFPNNPGWSRVQPLPLPEGGLIPGEELIRAAAAYSFRYTTDGASADYVEYVECRALIPGQAILVITHIAPLADYQREAGAVRALLDRLTMP